MAANSLQTERRRADLRRIFSADKTELHANIGRMAVLLEDLRVELKGAEAVSLMAVDELGPTIRKMYFIRRSFATIYEFIECVDRLDRSAEFQPLKKQIQVNPRLSELWSGSLEFLGRKDIKDRVTKLRHNLGGHFGEEAARSVIAALNKRTTPVDGDIEIYQDPNDAARAGVRLFFAETFAGEFLLKDCGDASEVEYIRTLMEMIHEAYVRAAHATHVLVGLYLVPRFRELSYPQTAHRADAP